LLAKLRDNKTELLARLQHPAVRTFPPSFAQRRFFNLQKLNPADAFYNVPFVFRLSGDLNVDLLRTAFNEIVKRHENLRTTLEERGGELVQVIAPEGGIDLTYADPDGPLPDRLRTEMERPFDLGRQSGLRVLLLRKATSEYFLQFVLHNTLFDQSSLLVLLHELHAANATVHGFRSSFRDWAAEISGFPAEVAEMALAHQVGSAVEQAYRRSDLFARRRQLAEAWAAFCAGSPAGEVVPLHQAV